MKRAIDIGSLYVEKVASSSYYVLPKSFFEAEAVVLRLSVYCILFMQSALIVTKQMLVSE